MNHPVSNMFKLRPAPPRGGVVLDLVYFKATTAKPDYWVVRLYRENLDSLNMNGEDAIAVHNWVSDIMRSLRSVEDRVYLEVADRVPRRNNDPSLHSG